MAKRVNLRGKKGDKGDEGSRGSSVTLFKSVNGTLSQINGKECVRKCLNDGRDQGKIKEQKYLKNVMKNKSNA